MLIYQVGAKNHTLLPTSLPGGGIEVVTIAPSVFSFITSMRIATECKRQVPDAVFAFTARDALAAISARKINVERGEVPYSVFLYAEYSSKPPLTLSVEIARYIDALIFDCEETKNLWRTVKNIKYVRRLDTIPLPAADTTLPDAVLKPPTPGALTLAYVAAIDSPSSLGVVIDTMIKTDDNRRPRLIVAGTGKAAAVMPMVKKARANRLDVEWLGDDYELTDIMKKTDAFVMSSPSPTYDEKKMLAAGIPFLEPSHIVTPFDNREKRSQKSVEKYKAFYAPEVFVNSVHKLIKDCR